MILLESQSLNGAKTYKEQQKTMSSIRYITDNEDKQDDLMALRKKMHKLLKENFEIKEENSKIKTELVAFQKQKEAHRENMRCLLEQVAKSEKQKQILKKSLKEFQALITKQQMQIAYVKEQSDSQKHQIDHLLHLNKNLDTENKMVISIKNKYSLDVAKLKIELQNQKKNNEQIMIEHSQMAAEIKILVEDINILQDQLNRRGNEVRNYQQKSAERQFAVKHDRENQQRTEEEIKKLKQKCQKYKRKCQTYKQERDELAMQISRANQQIDSHTLRKYFQE